ncbi:tRNA 2-selenouridine(34) synthase MnmH [Alcaligenaceae bacterium CGII-47]|nr:tRNA 2-selenouridine(34) synthase MnmH [Alcaligenaceae bacterium CGII-47]
MYDLHVSLDALADFDEIIDVRTPMEFAEDHIPGALNAPVLNNEERELIGTMYAQESPFKATRIGAALVARNIAKHLESQFADRPRTWRPLVYCWRGGKRSGAMTSWLNMIGWPARQLRGGYKTYRRDIVQALDTLPQRFDYHVLLGPTGTGKTRLLQAIGQTGAQVLDLEALASHRGSLLGALPRQPQPSQKLFETRLIHALRRLDPTQPVFIEAESSRIGRVTLPKSLLVTFHQGRCIDLQASLDERVAFLLQDYATLFDDPENFKQQLARMIGLHSKKEIAGWQAMIDADRREALFTELLNQHYDPAYARSQDSHFSHADTALPYILHPNVTDLTEQAAMLLERLAEH